MRCHGGICVTPCSLQAICALQEMFKVAEMESCAKEAFGKIFAALLLAAANYIGVTMVGVGATSSANSKQVPGASTKLLPLRCVVSCFLLIVF